MRAIYLVIVLMGLTLNLWAVEGTTCRALFDPVLVGPSQAEAELDRQLQTFIPQFGFEAVERIEDFDPDLLELGSLLFGDTRLSMTGDKSCFACHVNFLATGDNFPLALGVEAKYGVGPSNVIQGYAKVTKRHTLPLFNKGHKEFTHLFADGRVSYDSRRGQWVTPDPGLNQAAPGYEAIAKTLSSPLAAQALFPMVDVIEMRGESHQGLSNLQVWDRITQSIVADPKYRDYFDRLFPGQTINIGHIGNALAEVEKTVFQVTTTRWDKYLRGDLEAMTEQQKRGAVLFAGKAKCATCHNGKHLTNFSFQNMLIPAISQTSLHVDKGRFDFTGRPGDEYRFMVPPLRNIGIFDNDFNLSAPYFHNGSALTLREVLNHYNDPIGAFILYTPEKLNETYVDRFQIFQKEFVRVGTEDDRRQQLASRSPGLDVQLRLTEDELDDLEEFLKNALVETEKETTPQMDRHTLKDTWKLPKP